MPTPDPPFTVDKNAILGLPSEEEMSYEQALALTWQYFNKDCSGLFSAEEVYSGKAVCL